RQAPCRLPQARIALPYPRVAASPGIAHLRQPEHSRSNEVGLLRRNEPGITGEMSRLRKT
ncbi:MAG: hypothetical protein WKF63_05665, partial [Thermomicrobiales bacterium]